MTCSLNTLFTLGPMSTLNHAHIFFYTDIQNRYLWCSLHSTIIVEFRAFDNFPCWHKIPIYSNPSHMWLLHSRLHQSKINIKLLLFKNGVILTTYFEHCSYLYINPVHPKVAWKRSLLEIRPPIVPPRTSMQDIYVILSLFRVPYP